MYPNQHHHSAPQQYFHQQSHQQYSYLPPTEVSGDVMDPSGQSRAIYQQQQQQRPSPQQQPHQRLPSQHHYTHGSTGTGSGHSSPASDSEMASSSNVYAAGGLGRMNSISPTNSSHGRHRRGSPVSLEAPTQPRRYTSTSTTSRKDVPAYFARRRVTYQVSDGEEDELTEEPLAANATDQEKIEYVLSFSCLFEHHTDLIQGGAVVRTHSLLVVLVSARWRIRITLKTRLIG